MWADGSFQKASFSEASWLYNLSEWLNSIWRSYVVPKEVRAIAAERDK